MLNRNDCYSIGMKKWEALPLVQSIDVQLAVYQEINACLVDCN